MNERLWLAYHGDFSEMVVFITETECLRYAVTHHMEAMEVEYGRGLLEQIRDAWKARA